MTELYTTIRIEAVLAGAMTIVTGTLDVSEETRELCASFVRHYSKMCVQVQIAITGPRQGIYEGVVQDIRYRAALSHRSVDTAPKDGRMIRLLVRYDPDKNAAAPLRDDAWHSTGWTIGFNNLANTDVDEWQIAGWDWTQDCFCDGHGELIGWLPFEVE